MLLANYNIQEFVTEQINSFLAEDELDFSNYKTLILNKSPIPIVHSTIVTTLNNSKKSDQIEVQKALEKQTYKNQLAEDEKQKKNGHSASLKDEELKERLTRELNHIPTLERSFTTECALLNHQLIRLLEAVHHHEPSVNKIPKPISINKYTHEIEDLRKSILDYETKIQTIIEQRKNAQMKLQEIETRTEQRLEHQKKRTRREQARVGYLSTGEGIQETLSSKNRTLLSNSITDQYKALEKKCAELIQETEQINFAWFLEQLPSHLAVTKKLTAPEIDALKTILKLMKQHLLYEQQSVSTLDSLSKKKQSISLQLIKLQGLKVKLNTVREDNPSLTSTNQHLITLNEKLAISLDHNSNLRVRLGTPSLLLFALTLIFTIPLILTINGVIPFFIAPALLFTLVAAPPAILLIATLVCGIAAIVYSFKADSNESEIKMNKKTIENNTNLIGRNDKSQQALQTTSIPNLEVQIKKNESLRDYLEISQEKIHILSKQTFKQATKIQPILHSLPPFLGAKNNQSKIHEDPELDDAKEEIVAVNCVS